jgi:large conductance mechanosensitive channel
MLKQFKAFIMRGNVVDLAVGVIMGAAFGKIVASLVSDVIMPPIGLLLGGVDFSNKFLVLKPGDHAPYASLAAARADKAAVVLSYGAFINTIVEFLIVGAAVFLLVQQISRIWKQPAPNTRDCPMCATSIPIAAIRCPHCTSDLAHGKAEEPLRGAIGTS